MKLAAEVAAEQDPKKFLALIVELNELLEEKERRLQSQGHPTRQTNFQVNSNCTIAQLVRPRVFLWQPLPQGAARYGARC